MVDKSRLSNPGPGNDCYDVGILPSAEDSPAATPVFGGVFVFITPTNLLQLRSLAKRLQKNLVAMTTLSRLRDRDVCKRALFLGAAEARAIPRAGLDQVSVTSGPAAAISSGIHALEEARVTTENSALEQVPYGSPIIVIAADDLEKAQISH